MKIVRREWEIRHNAVLFEVEDKGGKFVCSITGSELDSENLHPLMGGETAEALFDAKDKDIEAAAAQVIADARAQGIEHKSAVRNDPLHVSLILRVLGP